LGEKTFPIIFISLAIQCPLGILKSPLCGKIHQKDKLFKKYPENKSLLPKYFCK